LAEGDYASITIRQLAVVSGVGLGSFYEYFASKEDLARVCLHMRTKVLLAALQGAIVQCAGSQLESMVAALVEAHSGPHREEPRAWRGHYLLERQLSGSEAYRKMYERFVDGWAEAIGAAADPLAQPERQDAARVCLTILYGLFAHGHISAVDVPDLRTLSRQARYAIEGYLARLRIDCAPSLGSWPQAPGG